MEEKWIRLEEGFMDTAEFECVMEKAGAGAVLLYFHLCLMADEESGRLAWENCGDLYPYGTDRIRRSCPWYSSAQIEEWLQVLEWAGWLQRDADGVLEIAGYRQRVACNERRKNGMAENRYWWVKLRRSFFESETYDWLMSQPQGESFILIYQRLCMLTINTGGVLCGDVGGHAVPFTPERISRSFGWYSPEVTARALEVLEYCGLLVRRDDGCLAVADFCSLVGSETGEAARKRSERGKRTAAGPEQTESTSAAERGQNAEGVRTKSGKCPDNVRTMSGQIPENVTESKSIDIEIEKEEEYKEEENARKPESREHAGTEKNAGSRKGKKKEKEGDSPVIVMPLKDGTDYPVSEAQAKEWKKCFPSVDVDQQLRNMRAWLTGNPERRKTRRGILRFITGWLTRQQNEDGARTRDRMQDYSPVEGNPFAEYLDT